MNTVSLFFYLSEVFMTTKVVALVAAFVFVVWWGVWFVAHRESKGDHESVSQPPKKLAMRLMAASEFSEWLLTRPQTQRNLDLGAKYIENWLKKQVAE